MRRANLATTCHLPALGHPLAEKNPHMNMNLRCISNSQYFQAQRE